MWKVIQRSSRQANQLQFAKAEALVTMSELRPPPDILPGCTCDFCWATSCSDQTQWIEEGLVVLERCWPVCWCSRWGGCCCQPHLIEYFHIPERQITWISQHCLTTIFFLLPSFNLHLCLISFKYLMLSKILKVELK